MLVRCIFMAYTHFSYDQFFFRKLVGVCGLGQWQTLVNTVMNRQTP